MNDQSRLRDLFWTDEADAGCDGTFEVLDVYVELETAGEDVSGTYPGVAAHLRGCPACRDDYLGLRAAAGEK
jgi:predicted anti-sigma-YlaC factor YlaD